MRTLATQMRLRRLLRTQGDYQDRLVGEARTGPLAAAASTRLTQLLEDVRAAWAHESRGVDLGGLRSHVNRSLATMQAAAAGMRRTGADLDGLHAEFREAGVPLVIFLRGLDDSELPVLAELTGRKLARSA